MYQTNVWPKIFERGCEIWHLVVEFRGCSRWPYIGWASVKGKPKVWNFQAMWARSSFPPELSSFPAIFSLAGATLWPPSYALHRQLLAHSHHHWVGQSGKRPNPSNWLLMVLTILPFIFRNLFLINFYCVEKKEDILGFAIDYTSLYVILFSFGDNHIFWPK